MKVLFWVSPWSVNGDYNFFSGAVEKHLIKQANILSKQDVLVDFVLPSQFSSMKESLNTIVNCIDIPFDFSLKSIYAGRDVFADFYLEKEDVINAATEDLMPLLADEYDAILLWETPVPFLEKMYPGAVVINQMPGIFSRPPYPHTVLFDVKGLYRKGALAQYSREIQTRQPVKKHSELVDDFSKKVKSSIAELQPYKTLVEEVQREGQKTVLLPLQTSGHYAFKVDTGFHDQLHYLDSAVKGDDRPHLVTQYKSRFISDTPINEENYQDIQAKHPHVFYSEEFDKLDTPSQYLLEQVDVIKTASSSLGIQGMVWRKELETVGNTFIKDYATSSKAGGVSWDERCHNTLSFCLNYSQPLASEVTQNGVFLKTLIQKLIEKKGNQGLEQFVSFDEIEPKYKKNLLNGFRYADAEKGILVKTENKRSIRVISEFRALLDNKSIKAVSFDVFDTLVKRPVEKPADLFKFMDIDALKISDGVAVEFGKTRSLCEVETRNKLKEQEEISLSDIYHTIQDFYGLTDEVRDNLKSHEIELEVACISERGMGRKLFNMAKDSGKKIYLISDMYLDQSVVLRMLDVCNFTGYEKLYVSVNHSARKHSGKLYTLFLEAENLKPKELLHVGDNKETDINRAKEKGIHTFRWSSSIEWMRTNPVFKAIYHPRAGAGEKPRSAIAGLTSHKFFDSPVSIENMSSLTNGTPESLGYAVIGPLVLGYVKWIAGQVKDSGNRKLYFMAREGLVLKRVYDTLYEGKEGYPESVYLYGSRRVVRVANLKKEGDVSALVSSPYDPGVTLSSLIQSRFGIDFDSETASVFENNGVDAVYELSRSFEDRKLLNTVCKDLTDKILDNAACEREDYLAYLESVDFLDEEKPSIVDVGWKANIQGDLGNLVGKKLNGYYYATLQDSEKWLVEGHKHFAYYGTNISPLISNSALVQNRHLAEFLLCAPHKSTVRILRNNEGDFLPQYRDETGYKERKALITKVHNSAVEFASDYRANFGSFMGQIMIPPELAERAFKSLSQNPSKIDVSILAGFSFEDAVGGIVQKFLVPINPSLSPVWKKGFEVYHAKKTIKEKVLGQKNIHDDTAFTSSIYSSQYTFFNKLERNVFKLFLSDKKYKKLERDREAFYLDSKSIFLQRYYRVTKNV